MRSQPYRTFPCRTMSLICPTLSRLPDVSLHQYLDQKPAQHLPVTASLCRTRPCFHMTCSDVSLSAYYDSSGSSPFLA
ncbi:hypothetical protein FOMPIDRAFT_161975 [Fomitopsis schrenkii]|uniref:Uncharacterized protein n=1 Tax=Fomitopsis schrenkii TaxID=2126942 RepID=S8E4V1_FOMSC|nr:hypothetical protein FOMPIDRAFT_161975 [Fomitopsis schrenkii]